MNKQETQPDPFESLPLPEQIEYVRIHPEKEKLINFYQYFPGGFRRELLGDPDADIKEPNRLLGKSLREFTLEIDQTITELGIDPREIERLQETPNPLSRIRLNEVIFPIYKVLRQKGYPHQDLTT